jgi:hypothetical protein
VAREQLPDRKARLQKSISQDSAEIGSRLHAMQVFRPRILKVVDGSNPECFDIYNFFSALVEATAFIRTDSHKRY